jgi:hypothetical protein
MPAPRKCAVNWREFLVWRFSRKWYVSWCEWDCPNCRLNLTVLKLLDLKVSLSWPFLVHMKQFKLSYLLSISFNDALSWNYSFRYCICIPHFHECAVRSIEVLHLTPRLNELKCMLQRTRHSRQNCLAITHVKSSVLKLPAVWLAGDAVDCFVSLKASRIWLKCARFMSRLDLII